jgi:hypothetical protein
MAEIIRKLKSLPESEPYIPAADEYVITEDHSISDVLRFCVEQLQGEKSEVAYLLETMEL